MKIAVCLKQVPDTTELQLNAEDNTLCREGVEAILNPNDEYPLELALRIAQRTGGEVTAVTMGPPQAVEVLRKALACGADDAIILTGREFAGSDTWATSLALSRALSDYDVILFGKQAIDGDTGQVGPAVATHLGYDLVTDVTGLQAISEGKITVKRLTDYELQTVRVATPVCMTVLKETGELRMPGLTRRIKALTQDITTLSGSDLNLQADEIGVKGSPTCVERVTVITKSRDCLEITGTPGEQATELLKHL